MSDYVLHVTNMPDGDGDYCARITYGEDAVKTFYRKDRDAAIALAKEWVVLHKAFDVNGVERIEL